MCVCVCVGGGGGVGGDDDECVLSNCIFYFILLGIE